MYRATTFLNSRSGMLRLGCQLPNHNVLDFEFLKTLLLRIRVFRDVRLCLLMSVSLRCEGKCCLLLGQLKV
jgi:hypothetical protein